MSQSNNNVLFEALEGRSMMSGTPAVWAPVAPVAQSTVPVLNAVKAVSAAVTKTPVKKEIVEPTVTDASIKYTDFSSSPLFSTAGPKADDIQQGYVGDCYFLSSLAAVAKTNPAVIRRDITTNKDGTYTVKFLRAGKAELVTVDAKLPTWSDGQLAYANLGAQKSVWVAVMEKAFTVFRTHGNSYATIEGGWMSEVAAELGMKSKSVLNTATPATLLKTLQVDVAANRAVTFATKTTIADGTPLIGDHAYTVVKVNLDTKKQPVSVTLRNPWGVDGAGNDGANDGYVTLTAAQAKAAFAGEVAAWA